MEKLIDTLRTSGWSAPGHTEQEADDGDTGWADGALFDDEESTSTSLGTHFSTAGRWCAQAHG